MLLTHEVLSKLCLLFRSLEEVGTMLEAGEDAGRLKQLGLDKDTTLYERVAPAG